MPRTITTKRYISVKGILMCNLGDGQITVRASKKPISEHRSRTNTNEQSLLNSVRGS